MVYNYTIIQIWTTCFILVCFQLLKYRGSSSTVVWLNSAHREQGGGATGRGRMGTMARGDGCARAWGAGVHTGYVATTTAYSIPPYITS